jgi:two-component system cell cycle sensor histidine kinase/response regulator CckA
MNARPLKVLIIDNNLDRCSHVTDLLLQASAEGYSVACARVDDAAGAIERRDADVILLCSHPRLLQLLPRESTLAPILVLTDREEDGIGLEALRSGAADCLDNRKLEPVTLDRAIRYALERADAGTEAHRMERRYRSMFDNAVYGVFEISPDGHILAANRAMARLLGYASARELLANCGLFGPDSFAGETQARELKRLIEQNDVVLSFELEVRRPDHIAIWVSVNSYAIRDAGGDLICYQGSLEDITQRKQLQGQVCQRQKMDSIGDLTTEIAHYFGNSLSVIQGHATLLQAEKELPARAVESILQIALAAERAAHLTRQLLLIGRPDAIQPVDLDLNDLISGVSRQLRKVLGADRTLQIHSSANLPLIKADAALMEQVLSNLVLNARDAMPQGGQLVIHTSHATVDEAYVRQNPDASAGSFVCLRVTDSGCGIPREHLHRIFEPFFTTKHTGISTGLGLAMVYGIVKHHRGWIQVSSELAQGTTVLVFFPSIGVKPVAHPPVPPTAASGVILVAEDDAALRQLAQRLLGRYGYHVLAAPSGHAALELWQEHKASIQLLLTDMVMPDGITGRELAEQLLADKPELKVVYSSGYNLDLIKKDLVLEEGVNFVQKPYEVQKLLQIVAGHLRPGPVSVLSDAV